MRIELDTKKLKRAIERSKNDIQSMKTKNEKLTTKFISKATDNLKYIASTSIDKFYEDYEPHFYQRTYDLYNTYRISVTEDEWKIDFDSSWMMNWHRVDEQDPEYIFENSFIRGWHGGALSGEGHPNPGVPYWRKPDVFVPTATGGSLLMFSHQSPWLSPALKSPSPYEEIVRKSNLYMELEIAKYHESYNENLDEMQRKVIRNLERIR